MTLRSAYGTLLACCSLALLAHLSEPALAQDMGRANPIEGELGERLDEGPPPPARQNVVPLTSSFVLDGVTLDYGARGFVSAGVLDGAERDASFDLTGTYAFESDLSEGIEANLFRRHQSGWYLQLRSADDRRTITTIQEQSGNLLGTRAKVTVTGSCIDPKAAPDSFCTYLPGLEVDRDSIDPNTLLPGRFIVSSDFGQTIGAGTHEALQAPGFQRGVEGADEVVGLSLDLPNTGFMGDPTRTGTSSVSRYESVEQRLLVTLSRVRQNLYSNDQRASLDRTIRSFALLEREEWTRTAMLLQLAGWVMPPLDARLPAGPGDPNLRISNNLFLSANNLRLPSDSITTYQSSLSWVTHRDRPARRASETPVAWSNGIWLGFSPVRDLELTAQSSYSLTGPRTTIESSFSQGGLDGDWDDVIEGTVTIVDTIDQQIDQIDFSDVDNLFVQAGADVTTQEAVQRIVSREVSTYRYVPHLSFTGNRTSGTSVFRYYMGVLLDDDANAYVGADFSLNDEQGWSAYLRAEAYSHPDLDHYSQVEGRLGRRLQLGEGRALTLGVAAHAEIDRPNVDGTVPRLGEGANTLDLLGAYEAGPLNLTLRQRFSDLGSDDRGSSTTFGVSYRINPRLGLTAEVTPRSTEESYIQARLGLSVGLDDEPDAPTLRMQWARTRYDYGEDAAGRSLGTSEDVFLAAIQMRF